MTRATFNLPVFRVPEIGSLSFRVAAVAAGVAAAGVWFGRPAAALLLSLTIVACFAVGQSPGVFACCVLVSALGSAATPELKDAGLAIRWLALAVMAVWPLVVMAGLRFEVARPRVLAAAGAFCAWALLTSVWSAVPSLTVQRALAFGCLLWVALVVAPQILDDEGSRRSFLRWIAVACILGSIAALAVAVVLPSTGRPLQLLRGWLENSNTMGLWAACLAPAVPILVRDRRRWLVLALPGAVVVLSASRSALLVFAALLLLELRVAKRTRWMIASVLVVAAAAAMASPLKDALPNTGLGKLSLTEGGVARAITGARNESWDASWTLAKDAPFEGYGFGSGDQLFALSGLDRTFTYYQGANSGSSYLTTLLEGGVVGLALLGILLWSTVRPALAPPPTEARRALRRMAISVLGVALVESFLTSPGSPFAVIAWVSLGLAAVGETRDRPL